jgi:uracil-DNA glycosylase family protein
LESLRAAAKECRGCNLYLSGTQTVFGEGASRAEVVMIGEQPGDREDLAGKPFVGPAGKLLADAIAEAGLDRTQIYITNVVKHFKWEPRGKRRIHKTPSTLEISACRPWLNAELQIIKPKVVVCLGATAARTILGKTFKVTQRRGKLIPIDENKLALATVHPSSILRARDHTSRQQEMKRFLADLKVLSSYLAHKKNAA